MVSNSERFMDLLKPTLTVDQGSRFSGSTGPPHQSFLRNHLRIFSFPGFTPGFGWDLAPLSVAQIALRQDRGDLRDHVIERMGDGWVARHPVLLAGRRGRGGVVDAGRDGTVVMSRWSPLDTARGRCRRHPQRAPSYGRCRCLAFSRTFVARLPVDTYRHGLGNVETRVPEANRAVKQRAAKNGESENQETKSRGGRVFLTGESGSMWEGAYLAMKSP